MPVADGVPGFFAYEDGDKIAFAVDAALPPVCLKCARQKGVRYRRWKFTARRTEGRDIAAQLISGRVKIQSARVGVPVCKRCYLMRWLALGAFVACLGAMVGAVALETMSLMLPGFFGALVSAFVFFRANVRADRVDEDGVVRVHGVHRLTRSDIIDASEGRYQPDPDR